MRFSGGEDYECWRVKEELSDDTHRPRSGLQHTAHRLLRMSPAWERGISTDCVCAR